jgi:glycosyltransferase involved in cell wall biosynthesis
MRVVYEIERLSTNGGIERIITAKASYMAEQWGWDVIILVLYKGCEKSFFPISPKVRIQCLDIKPRWNIITVPLALYRLNKAIKDIKPDVYITVQHIGAVSCLLNTHHTKTIYEAHGVKSKMIHPFAVNIAERYADAVVTLTHSNAECYRSAKKVAIIPNFSTLSPYTSPDYNSHIAISLGRDCMEKDFPRMYNLWNRISQKHSDWELAVHHNTKDVIKAYTSGSIFLMTSRFEGFPLVLIEAMQCGLPCIAFDCPQGPREIIEDGKNGFLIPYDDDALFIEKLTFLMENPEEREKMGRAAKESVNRFDKEKIMNQWKELLTEL